LNESLNNMPNIISNNAIQPEHFEQPNIPEEFAIKQKDRTFRKLSISIAVLMGSSILIGYLLSLI